MTTVLSACGGFTTRRNSHIQAREVAKNSSPVSVSCGHAIETFDQQKKQQHDLRTATTNTTATTATTATTITTTTTTNICCRLNVQQIYSAIPTANCWVLGALLLIVTFSLPPSTNATPHRLHGRHLILRHHHHVHLRSAEMESYEFVHPTKATLSDKCGASKLNVTKTKMQQAMTVSSTTRNVILEHLTNWLLKDLNKSVESATEEYNYQQLALQYPLYTDVHNNEYNAETTEPTVEELTKILDSLNIVHHLLKELNKALPLSIRLNYFNYIIENIAHNKFEVLELLSQVEHCVHIPSYSYNKKHNNLHFALVAESLKLLDVIKAKYEVMLNNPNVVDIPE